MGYAATEEWVKNRKKWLNENYKVKRKKKVFDITGHKKKKSD